MNTDILYVYNNKVYLNITNKCSCSCTFCIRNTEKAIGEAENLWFEHSPSFEEVKNTIDSFNFTGYDEVIFCGYGEPTCEFELLIKTSQYVKERTGLKVRVNTNGQGNLINKHNIVSLLCKNVDAVSISLNASDEEKYQSAVRSEFGKKAYKEMLEFARQCRVITDNVQFSVVDIIGNDEVKKCRKIADEMNIPLRVRKYQP